MWTQIRRFLLPLLGSIALNTSALAATYYAAQTAAGDTTGSSCANAKSLAGANTAAVAGDVIRLCAGTYTTDPNPLANGTEESRIAYIGDPVTPANVVMDSTVVSRDYITVRGVRFTGPFIFQNRNTTTPAIYDSLTKCTLDGGMRFEGAQNCIVYDVTGTWVNEYFAIDGAIDPFLGAASFADTLRKGTFTVTNNSSLNPMISIGKTQVSRSPSSYHSECLLDSLHFSVTNNLNAALGPTEGIPLRLANWTNSTISDVYISAQNYRPTALFQFREKNHGNTFRRDTFVVAGAPGVMAFQHPGTLAEKSGDNNYYDCIFRNTTYAENTFCTISSDSIYNSFFIVTAYPGLRLPKVGGHPTGVSPITTNGISLLDHCTFATLSDTVATAAGGKIANYAVRVGDEHFWDINGRLPIKNSVIYGGLFYDFTSISFAKPYAQNNFNTFVKYTYTTQQGDQSITWIDGAIQRSRPRSGYPWYSATSNAADGNSGWAGASTVNPLAGGWGGIALTDTSTVLAFNPQPQATSHAVLLRDANCWDTGMLTYGLHPEGPRAITDLQVIVAADSTVSLRWTTPIACDTIPATQYSYLAKYTAITEADSSSRILLIACDDLPDVLGGTCTFGTFLNGRNPVAGGVEPTSPGTVNTVQVHCLETGASYYYTIWTRGSTSGTWSRISNTPKYYRGGGYIGCPP